jgi:LacI family transcriptional regulator
MAIGAIRALQDCEKRVPEDVSVVGLDGLSIGQYMVPRLSTVAQSAQELADRSVDLLLQGISRRESQHVIVPVTLERRESVKTLA